MRLKLIFSFLVLFLIISSCSKEYKKPEITSKDTLVAGKVNTENLNDLFNKADSGKIYLLTELDPTLAKMHTGSSGETYLHKSASAGYKNVAESLIKNGANVNARDKSGLTPLMSACKNGQHEMVEYLLSKGAELDFVEERGKTALHFAVISGNEDIVSLLISKGARPSMMDAEGKYALEYAKENDKEIINILSPLTPSK